MFYSVLSIICICIARSALAESELEYNTEHVSTAVYVRVPIVQCPSALQELVGKLKLVECLLRIFVIMLKAGSRDTLINS